MGALGQLLELIHDAHDGVSTFEVEYRDWGLTEPSNKLSVTYSESGAPQVRWKGAGPLPGEAVSTRRIWMRPPDMIRVEISVGDELLRLAVRNGAEWWRWDAEQGVSRGSALPNRRGVATLPSLLGAPMIDVRQLITSVRFEPTGVGERAGRSVVLARASRACRRPSGGRCHTNSSSMPSTARSCAGPSSRTGSACGSGARSRFSTTLRSPQAASRSKSPAIAETA